MKKQVCLLVLILSCAAAAQTAKVRLVKDINTFYPKMSSSPYGARSKGWQFPKVGNYWFARVNIPGEGYELGQWLPAGGSGTVIKVQPGPNSGYPIDFVTSPTKLYFAGRTSASEHSEELFEFTPGGTAVRRLTHFVTTINGHQGVDNPVYMKGCLYFTTETLVGTTETHRLWKVDPTTTPATVVDITPTGMAKGFEYPWSNPTVLNNSKVIFQGTTAITQTSFHCTDAWVTDGTAAGTLCLVPPLTDRYCPIYDPVVVGSRIFYSSYQRAPTGASWHLMVTDGTPAGTMKFCDLWVDKSYAMTPVALGTKLIFGGPLKSGTEMACPYMVDTAASSPKVVRLALNSTSQAEGYISPVKMGGKVYFAGWHQGSTTHPHKGIHLWATDGTVAGTTPITRTGFGTAGYSWHFWHAPVVSISGTKPVIYFTGWLPSSSNSTSHLFKTDGTVAGTVQLDVHSPTAMEGGGCITASPTGVFFAFTDQALGNELFHSDGTSAGTGLHTNFAPEGATNEPSSPYGLVEADGVAFFRARDGSTTSISPTIHGSELWKTDGTASGTVMVKDVHPGYQPSSVQHTHMHGRTCYFVATDGAYALWKSDGTTAGTVKVSTLITKGEYFEQFINLGDKVIFRGYSTTTGHEPYVLDTKTDTISPLKDIRPGPADGDFHLPVRWGGHIYFRAYEPGGTDYHLWKTDGTPTGTVMVTTTTQLLRCEMICPVGKKLFFNAFSTAAGNEVWVSDGTTAGTRMVKDLNAGSGNGSTYNLFPVGDKVMFHGDDGTNTGLFISDGTPTGTTFVVNPGGGAKAYEDPRPKHNATSRFGVPLGHSGKTIFWPDVPGDGVEPWVTDGTTKGTFKLADFNTVPRKWTVYYAIPVGERRVLWSGMTDKGMELCGTDGTRAGTWCLDLNPGPADGCDSCPVMSGGRLLFAGNDGKKGFELYSFNTQATAQLSGRGTCPDLHFWSDDPVLGSKMGVTLEGLPATSAAVFLMTLPLPFTRPPLLPGLFLDLTTPLHLLGVVAGTGPSLVLPLPKDPNMAGINLSIQAFAAPGTTTPFGVNISNGVLLHTGME